MSSCEFPGFQAAGGTATGIHRRHENLTAFHGGMLGELRWLLDETAGRDEICVLILTAADPGPVNRTVPAADPLAEARRFAHALLAKAP